MQEVFSSPASVRNNTAASEPKKRGGGGGEEKGGVGVKAVPFEALFFTGWGEFQHSLAIRLASASVDYYSGYWRKTQLKFAALSSDPPDEKVQLLSVPITVLLKALGTSNKS